MLGSGAFVIKFGVKDEWVDFCRWALGRMGKEPYIWVGNSALLSACGWRRRYGLIILPWRFGLALGL